MAKLFVNNSTLTISSSDYIVHVSGVEEKRIKLVQHDISSLVPNLSEEGIKPLDTDKEVQCCSFSSCNNFSAVCWNKYLLLFSTKTWTVVAVTSIHRKASCIRFFPSKMLIAVGDKTGDISFFSYSYNDIQREDFTLGHNSMLLDILISKDEKYILSCDRDEKIRVSNFPNVYNIQAFCLAHTSFVSCIKFLPTDDKVLVSAGGDGSIYCWNYEQGEMLTELQYKNNMSLSTADRNKVKENVKPVIKLECMKVDMNLSLIAFLLYKVSQIHIMGVSGGLKSKININFSMVIRNDGVMPWDIAFLDTNIICLLPDKDCLFKIWKYDENVYIENTSYLGEVNKQLANYWDLFEKSCTASEQISLLFKREFDNVLDYHNKKRARLSNIHKNSK